MLHNNFPVWLLYIGNISAIFAVITIMYLLGCLITNVSKKFRPEHVLVAIIVLLASLVILAIAAMLTTYELRYAN